MASSIDEMRIRLLAARVGYVPQTVCDYVGRAILGPRTSETKRYYVALNEDLNKQPRFSKQAVALYITCMDADISLWQQPMMWVQYTGRVHMVFLWHDVMRALAYIVPIVVFTLSFSIWPMLTYYVALFLNLSTASAIGCAVGGVIVAGLGIYASWRLWEVGGAYRAQEDLSIDLLKIHRYRMLDYLRKLAKSSGRTLRSALGDDNERVQQCLLDNAQAINDKRQAVDALVTEWNGAYWVLSIIATAVFVVGDIGLYHTLTLPTVVTIPLLIALDALTLIVLATLTRVVLGVRMRAQLGAETVEEESDVESSIPLLLEPALEPWDVEVDKLDCVYETHHVDTSQAQPDKSQSQSSSKNCPTPK